MKGHSVSKVGNEWLFSLSNSDRIITHKLCKQGKVSLGDIRVYSYVGMIKFYNKLYALSKASQQLPSNRLNVCDRDSLDGLLSNEGKLQLEYLINIGYIERDRYTYCFIKDEVKIEPSLICIYSKVSNYISNY